MSNITFMCICLLPSFYQYSFKVLKYSFLFVFKSSKKAEKRALKQQQAIYASLTRNRNRGISITNEEQNYRNEAPSDTNTPSENNTQDTQVNDDAKKKKARGPTRMAKLKGKEPVEVDLNVHGQIVDGSLITLSSYIKTVAREHVPVTLQSWKQLDDQMKDMLWSSLLVCNLYEKKKYILLLCYNM